MATHRLINLSVYDLSGRLVNTLVDGPGEPGYYSVDWDGRDLSGRAVGSGIYFCRLTVRDPTLPFPRYSGVRIEGSGAEAFTLTTKALLVR